MNITTAVKEFKGDAWFQPILHFINYDTKDLTIDVVKKYLDSEKLEYYLEGYDNNDDNFTFQISSTNQYDLSCVFKRDDGQLHTQHIYNEVYNVSYLGKTKEHPTDSIIISLHHKDGFLVSEDTWKYWLACRFDIPEEEIQENRNTKLITLLDEKSDEKMAKDFNQHLIRHIQYLLRSDSGGFISSVYEFYKKRGYITKRQLENLKEIMYYNKGYNY